MIGIATAARTAGAAVLVGATALGLTMGTAHAAPGAPDPPSGEGTLYGDPAAAAPFWRYQQYDDDCVPMAVAGVVGELTGHQPSEPAVIKVAQTTPSTVHSGPIYTKPKKRKPGSGTSFEDEPALLAHYGIHGVDTDKESAAKSGVPTGMTALEQDLAKGRRVIVALNAELIWREPVEDKTQTANPSPTMPRWSLVSTPRPASCTSTTPAAKTGETSRFPSMSSSDRGTAATTK